MKDKVKGLIVGLTIGSLISGTAAFAASSQIEVAFRSIKYMFDGVEKVPADGKGFVYEGSTYVPLRFVSEALGKKVEWDEANETIWIGSNPNKVVATYKGGTVTKGEFDTFFAMQGILNASHAASKDDPEYQKSVLMQLIQNRILYSKSSETDQKSAKESAPDQISKWKAKYGEANVLDSLKKNKVTETELQYFLVGSLTAENYIKSSITDEQLKAKYDDNLKQDKDAYTIASVRHILIGLTNEDGSAKRTKEEALKLAKDIQQKIKNGEDFAKLAKEVTDDPGSKETGGLYEDAGVSGWVPEFKKAVIEQPVGVVGDPIETQFGYHVIKVESRSVKSFDSVKDSLRGSLEQAQYQQFVEKELPGLIEKIDLSE
ncbi:MULTISPECIES: peptidylprolyl isomerase [Paenibacillus]|uniref:Peptidylprolyl isomerase n=1 Tax=Paenibacillus violae TaxID=3077234 RepID=A0ABU3R706_9BACL|nr:MULTISPECIES: peptidylprolyl isomerase [Paenibacillus]MDU0200054.1 peptidylprolyl isomerase [Paenibacillus sp. PFR10]MEC0270920.1 peptidylprolyl isomerase [Paenibacillus anseongense]